MKAKHLLFLILFYPVLFTGCATMEGQKSFELAGQLVNQNRIEEAITHYEEAVRLDPDNKDFKRALKSAKELMISEYVSKATAFLGIDPLTFENLKMTQAYIDRALKLLPESNEAKQLNNRLLNEIGLIAKKAELLYLYAEKGIETNNWEMAVEKLREIKIFYPNYLDLPVKIPMTENAGISFYWKEADKFESAEDWERVIKIMKSSLIIMPQNIEILDRLKKAQNRHTSIYYLSKAEFFSKTQDWDDAKIFLKKAKSLNPDEVTIQKIEQLQKDAARYYIQKGAANIKRGSIYLAYNNLANALEQNPDIRKSPGEADIFNKLIGIMTEKAEHYETNGLLGNALVYNEKALSISIGSKEIALKIQSLKDKIKKRIVRKIVLMDFSSPQNNQVAGKVITDTLLSYLTNNSIGDIQILHKDLLGTSIKEIELGQTDHQYDLDAIKKAGRLKGADIFIFGNVLYYDVEHIKDEGFKFINAVTGTKSISNPAYQQWLSLNPKRTENDLMSAPPQLINEEIRETVKYKVASHKKIAKVNLSFRIIDVEEGGVIITKTFNNKVEVEDTYSEGVEFAKIPFKQINLPSDITLLEQAIEKTVAELGQAVLSKFQNSQALYSNNAQMLEKRNELERAVEKYIDAIYVEELKNISTPVSENARKEIEQLLNRI